MTHPDLLYPLSLRLAGRRVVVVGGGTVAVRRVAGLRAAGADVLVVAPELSPTLAGLAAQGLIATRAGEYQPADLAGAWLVLACTDQPSVNAAVAADAERQRLWCVRADGAGASPAWVPAVGRAAGVTVAVNASRDPRRAAQLRDQLMDVVAAAPPPPTAGQPPGSVAIVGGGPGDPGLITAAGLARLRGADVVVADRLGPLELLDLLAPGVQIIDAAKVPGGPAMRQEHINEALVEHARAGRRVVRLKGGDPFVFGRGQEEVEACRAAGVPVAVIPGVTSAVAVPAAAGIPLTHRGLSQGFCVMTGHVSPTGTDRATNWAALARSGLTLVLLMAIEHLPAIAGHLLAAGLPAGTACACVANGWLPGQRVVAAPLTGIAEAVTSAGIANPAVIVIGEVAGFASGPPEVPAAPGPGHAPPGPQASPAPPPPRRVLILGGARSGKSATAERMLAGYECVDYLATGAPPGQGDAEWDARVGAHRDRRPPHWRTLETLGLDEILAIPSAPLLVDCLSTWLARIMDDCGAWEDAAAPALAARLDRLVAAWTGSRRHVVAVSSEVGSGVIPASAAGRRFRDELGRLNSRLASVSDEVWLCTAGIPRRLR